MCVAGLISGLGLQEQNWWLVRPAVGHHRTPPEIHVCFRQTDSQVFTPNVAQTVLCVLTQRKMFEPLLSLCNKELGLSVTHSRAVLHILGEYYTS